MAAKTDLISIISSKFKMVVEGSAKAEDVKTTDDGNELSLYNVGVLDENSAGEWVGRRVRFYVINEAHPKETMVTDEETGVTTGTGTFTNKVEEASWLNGETPKTILEMKAEADAIETKEQKLQGALDNILGVDADPGFLGLEDNGEIKVVKLEINGVPRALSFLGDQLINLRDKSTKVETPSV